MTFQQQLGSLYEKSERVRRLASVIARSIGGEVSTAERAAQLAKCDLVTTMVGEFPELQGLMGRYYARHDGERPEVCEALYEQYLPRFAGDALPSTRTGMTLSMADKLDTIAGIFAIGQKPSGTRDPFGLRRAALGVLRIAIERRLDIDLRSLIAEAVELARADIVRIASERSQKEPAATPPGAALADEVCDYVFERLRSYYLEGEPEFSVTPEMFDAVLGTKPSSPLDFDARLHAVAKFLTLPDAQSLAAANKRIANILRKVAEPVPAHVDPELLRDPAEQVLGEQVLAIARDVEPRLASRDYTPALRELSALRPAVDGFFDSVLVMSDDARLRGNRLALLKSIHGLFMRVADLSRLPG